MPTNSSQPIVAVIGGGQLVRMMAPAAIRLNVQLRVLAESYDDPIAQVADVQIGSPSDPVAVRKLVEGADALTFEHEHIPPELLTELEAEGIVIRPGPRALLAAQDKVHMRRSLDALGLPTPRWAELNSALDAEMFSAEVGWPMILKAPRGGYDGNGVAVVNSAAETTPWFEKHPTMLGEELVDFTRELAVLVARRPCGELRAWAVTETIQVDGKCFQTTAPVLGLDNRVEQEALDVAATVAAALGVVGVLAVEMFQLREQRLDGARVVVNELAMRPHNSGHWTIDGAVTSQFEQHLRAVLDLPLGATEATAPWNVMVNVLGGSRTDLTTGLAQALTDPAIRVELYGKAVRPGRKVGHVSAHGRDIADVTKRALVAASTLRDIPDSADAPDGPVTAPMYAPPPQPRRRTDGTAIAPDYVVRPVDDAGQLDPIDPDANRE